MAGVKNHNLINAKGRIMKAKQFFIDNKDEIGLINLIESQRKYDNITNHTIPEIRALLGNIAQTIYQLGDLCTAKGLTRTERTQVIKDAFPTMDKNDRSKMRYYHENFDDIIKLFKTKNSTAVSVAYMVKTYQKFIKNMPGEIKSFELLALEKNKKDVKDSNKKRKKIEKQRKEGTLTSPVNAQDHLMNLAHVQTNIGRFARNGAYTNTELENAITGLLAFCELLEKCKIAVLQVVNV